MNAPLHHQVPTSPRASPGRFVTEAFRRLAVNRVLEKAILLCAAAAIPWAARAELTRAKEYQVKAAFVYNFLKFVEWPAESFRDAESPLVVGIVGDGPISDAMQETVKGRLINGRKVVVQRADTPQAARGVHVLFFSIHEPDRLAGWLRDVAGSRVLTIGETEFFAKPGGMINFVREGDKVRFEINMDSAEKAGLKISSQLLKLARTVRKNKGAK